MKHLFGVVTIVSMFCCVSVTGAFEPVSAFDDGFAVPSRFGGPDAIYRFPGMEALEQCGFAAFAHANPWGVDELAVNTGVAGWGNGRFGVSAAYTGTGFDLYGDEQEKLGLAYGIGRNVFFGIRATRTAMRIRGFGDAHAFGLDGGVILRPASSLYIAFTREDITGSVLGDSEEPIDGGTRGSLAWMADRRAEIVVSACKVRRRDLSVSAGCILMPAPMLRIGMLGGNEPDRLEFLCGVTWNGLRLDYRGLYHGDLGDSHGFSIAWKQKEIPDSI